MTILGDFNTLRTISQPGALLVGAINARYTAASVVTAFGTGVGYSSGYQRLTGSAVTYNPSRPGRPPVALSTEDLYKETQAVPATVASPGLLVGYAKYASYLLKIRISCDAGSSVGESYTVSAFLVNGQNVIPEGYQLVFPQSTPGSFIDTDLSGLQIQVPNGALMQVVPLYVPGTSPTPMSNVQVGVFLTPLNSSVVKP
jgi:hypothetical protein